MLGENRPNEVTLGNGFACGFPERLILRVPVRNPGRVPLAHQSCSFPVGDRPRARKTTNAAPWRSKAFLPGSVRDKTHGAYSGAGVAFALQASCQLRVARIKSQ